ncbi:MAG: methyl-accepting chemotaxis protein [Magnetococcales bacterium]|nr:methyl-accepting chemotaxis protein [Magnetococcales bacterium]
MRAINDFKVITKLGIGFGIVLLLLLFVALDALHTISQYKVNGPYYHEIILDKDLLADVLPPPLFILEPWQVVLESHDNTTPETIAKAQERLTALRKDYMQRHEFWKKEHLDSTLTDLMGQAHQPAMRFFDLATGDYLTALRQGNAQDAEQIVATLASHYATHRGFIDKVVTHATELSTQTEQAVQKRVTTAIFLIIAGTVMAILFGSFIAWSISQAITRPLRQGVALARDLADGNLTAHMESTRKDEIGELATSLNGMSAALKTTVQEITGQAGQVNAAAASFTQVSTGLNESAGTLGQQAATVAAATEEMSATMETIASAAEEISTNINTVAAAAEEMATNMTTISSAAEEANTNLNAVANSSNRINHGMEEVTESMQATLQSVETVASAMEELSTSLEEVRALCQTASSRANQAKDSITTTDEVMGTLMNSAREIDQVVTMINDIASLTNLLALNAAIEAAGAGEAGKGFSVVAIEVKDLARQTADATQLIATRISEIQAQASQAGDATRHIMKIIDNLGQSNDSILSAVEEQSLTLREVSRSMSTATTQTQSVMHLVQESSSEIQDVTRNVVEIASGIAEVTRSVLEASTGVNEVTRRINETSSGVQEVNRNIGAVAEAVREVAQSTGHVNQSAGEVQEAGRSIGEQATRMTAIAAALEAKLAGFRTA